MDDATLRDRLRAILELEAANPVDWALIEQCSAELQRSLARSRDYEPPHLVHHFLDDADIRQKDKEYGDAQRAEISRFVDTGVREHLESRSVSPLPFVLVAGVCVAVLIWALS